MEKIIKWIIGDLTPEDISRITPLYVIMIPIYAAAILISNIIACKVWVVGPFVFTAAIIIFPIVYIMSDIFTEIYLFKLSLIPIKINAILNIFMVAIFGLVIMLKPAPFWPNQDALIAILGTTWRIAIFSILGSFVGDYLNSVSLSIFKTLQRGKNFYIRSIESSIIGQAADTLIFITGSFLFTIPISSLVIMIICQYTFKILYEIVCLPVTCRVVANLKKVEGDRFDVIDFKTFKL